MNRHIFKTSKSNMDFMLLSDIHYNTNNTYVLEDIEKIIKRIHPMYVFFVGDFLDNSDIFNSREHQDIIISFFNKISKYSKIIVSYGNHEFYLGKRSVTESRLFKKVIEKINNVVFLDNSCYEDDNVYVVGLTIKNNYFAHNFQKEKKNVIIEQLEELSAYIKNVPSNKNSFLLCHPPRYMDDRDVNKMIEKFDYILSGHAHGGLTPKFMKYILPDHYGLFSSNKTMFVKNAYGVKKISSKQTFIISEGYTKLSKMSGMLRVFNNMFTHDYYYIDLTKQM